MVALAYDAHPILIDLVEERLEFARSLGVKYTVNLKTDNLVEKISEYTNGKMVQCALEASGANSAIRATLDIICQAGRIASSGSSRIVRVTFTVIGSSFLMTIRPSRSAVTE